MFELMEEGKILQFDVVCDDRNNTIKEKNSGVFHLLIKFKQSDCLNVTKIYYDIDLTQEDASS